MLSSQPGSLGFPSEYTQSSYYPGSYAMAKEEVAWVDRFLESKSIGTNNTRITKQQQSNNRILNSGAEYTVLQASVASSDSVEIGKLDSGEKVLLHNGDYSHFLTQICDSLKKAQYFADNELQVQYLGEYIKHFTTGDTASFKAAQTLWIQDRSPVVENVLGFVENYRDPAGTRAEFEGIVALADKDATRKLALMVEKSPNFIRELPWVVYYRNDENEHDTGPLESATFNAPDFTSIHGMCYL